MLPSRKTKGDTSGSEATTLERRTDADCYDESFSGATTPKNVYRCYILPTEHTLGVAWAALQP